VNTVFLHNKVVQLAKALTRVTRERDDLERKLTLAVEERRHARFREGSTSSPNCWMAEVASLRAALDAAISIARRERRAAQEEKEAVLNELADELGQVVVQRDLAFVQLEQRSPRRDSSDEGLVAPQSAALQLQLAHARRDLTVQSVSLHLATERLAGLRRDLDGTCSGIQTSSAECARAESLLQTAAQTLRVSARSAVTAWWREIGG